MSVTVDTRGKLCPLPLIMLRKAIKDNPHEFSFEVLTDNEISCSNLQDFIRRQQYSFQLIDNGDYTSIVLDTEGKALPKETEERTTVVDHTLNQAPEDRIVLLSCEKIGQGEEKLGEILMYSFLNALKEQDHKPTHVICYHSGVKLLKVGSETSVILSELIQRGIQLIACGTCVDYYGLKESIIEVKLSNMFDILELLSRSGRIIRP